MAIKIIELWKKKGKTDKVDTDDTDNDDERWFAVCCGGGCRSSDGFIDSIPCSISTIKYAAIQQ